MATPAIDPDQQQVSQTIFCAFDFETTGFGPTTDRIIEFGAVRFRDAGVLGSFEQLVDPGRPIPWRATNVHGITDAMVDGQADIETALQSFCAFIGDAVLIAHHSRFDGDFLRAALQRAGKPDLRNRLVDTEPLTRRAFPGLPSYSLPNLAEALGLPLTTAHRGLSDAQTCMYLFRACVEQMSVTDELALSQVLRSGGHG